MVSASQSHYLPLILALCGLWQAAPVTGAANNWKNSAVYRKQQFDRAVSLDRQYTITKCQALGVQGVVVSRTVSATSRQPVATISRKTTAVTTSTVVTTVSTDTTLVVPTTISTNTISYSTYNYTRNAGTYTTYYEPSTSTSYSVLSTTTLPSYALPSGAGQRMRQKVKRAAPTTEPYPTPTSADQNAADIDYIFTRFASYDLPGLTKQCAAILPKTTTTSTVLSVVPTTVRTTSTIYQTSTATSSEFSTYTSTSSSTEFAYTTTIDGGVTYVPVTTSTRTYTRTSPTLVASAVATVVATYRPLPSPYYAGCPRPTGRDSRPVQYYLSYNRLYCVYMTFTGPYSRSLDGYCEYSQTDGQLVPDGYRVSWCPPSALIDSRVDNGTFPWKLPNACPVEASGHLLVTTDTDVYSATGNVVVFDDGANAPQDGLSYLRCVYTPELYCVYTYDTGLLQTRYGGGVGCPSQSR